jgi:hypothetical protein
MPLDEGYRKQAALLVRTVPLVGSRRRAPRQQLSALSSPPGQRPFRPLPYLNCR